MEIRKLARAKINLCLHVVGQRPDGFHLLDSVVVFADVGDILTVSSATELSLELTGPFAADLQVDESNLVSKAAHLFPETPNCKVTLEKNLPVASGIGGGSTDAAAALSAFAEVSSQPMPSDEQSLALGADVPVCVFGRPVLMRGIGEELTPLTGFPPLHAVLVNPGIGVSTASVFNALQRKNNAPIHGELPACNTVGATIKWLQTQRNDLEEAAVAQAPKIGSVLDALESSGALLARMSGSGATCFGIYETKAQAVAATKNLKHKEPDWWIQETILQGSDHPGHNKI